MLCIKDRAKNGHFAWQNPWQVNSLLTNEDKHALTTLLRAKGYQVVEHADPDFGKPASTGGYTEIRWD